MRGKIITARGRSRVCVFVCVCGGGGGVAFFESRLPNL